MHLLLFALFSLRQVLGFPLPMALASDPTGNYVAYVLNESGIRSVWFAAAPGFEPKELWHSGSDDGQELTNLNVSSDGKYVVYVRGGAHDANWPLRPWPNPDSSVKAPGMTVMSLSTTGGALPKVLGNGDAPVISPDSSRAAF